MFVFLGVWIIILYLVTYIRNLVIIIRYETAHQDLKSEINSGFDMVNKERIKKSWKSVFLPLKVNIVINNF